MYINYYITTVCILLCITLGVIIGILSKPSYYYLIEYHTGDVSPAHIEVTSKSQCENLASDINDANIDYLKTHPEFDHNYILYAWCIP